MRISSGSMRRRLQVRFAVSLSAESAVVMRSLSSSFVGLGSEGFFFCFASSPSDFGFFSFAFFFGVSFFSFAGSSVKRNGPTESCTRSSSPNCISAPTRRKPIKIKMSRMMPITFSAVNRPPPSFYASRGFYALRGQCSPFSGTLPSFSVMALGSRIVPSSVMRS